MSDRRRARRRLSEEEKEKIHRREEKRIRKRSEKKQKKKNRGKIIAMRIYKFFFTLFAIIIVLLLLFNLFFTTKIKVTGNDYVSSSSITKLIKKDKFAVNNLYIMGKYTLGKGTLPKNVEKLTFNMGLPWVLNVNVVEKKIVACVSDSQNFAYIDKDGLIVYVGTLTDKNVPIINGVKESEINLYNKIDIDKDILKKTEEVQKYLKECNVKATRVECKGSAITVLVGDTDVNLGTDISEDQIKQINSMLESIKEKYSSTKGVLHLENYSTNPDATTFEPSK
ncbi:MAG: hypothetical protein LBM02_02975 [Lachnospiraceae bacterium]|jgi:cell division protein FtsQ|nr:hypothetical protein [Lachnospiraceae bacterium]